MKVQPIQILLLSVALIGGSCQPSVDGDMQRALVIDLVNPENVGRNVEFALVERELSGLESFDDLRGADLQLVRGGTLRAKEIAGSLVVGGSFEGGKSPKLRYDLDDGVVAPLDYSSLAMVSAFHHFSRVLQAVPELCGRPKSELIGNSPFELLFEPQISLEGATVSQKLNAFYFPGEKRQFGLLQRSELETISLGTNPLVIAHESGHAVFEWLFYDGRSAECDPDDPANQSSEFFPGRLDSEYVLRGINEGFADYFAFSFHGAADVFAGFDLLADGERDISANGTIAGLSTCESEFYCLGTLFAKTLYRSFGAVGLDAAIPEERAQFSRIVMDALAETRIEMQTRSLPRATAQSRLCNLELDNPVGHDEAMMGAFLDSFATSLPQNEQAVFCEEAIATFGDSYFPSLTRATCL